MQTPSRVNIALQSPASKTEDREILPFKLLLLGDFGEKDKDQPLARRQRMTIHPHNFNHVMTYFEPKIQFEIPAENDNESPISIQFEPRSMSDFHPDNLIQKIPHLKALDAKRSLLKELKVKLMNHPKMAQEIQQQLMAME